MGDSCMTSDLKCLIGFIRTVFLVFGFFSLYGHYICDIKGKGKKTNKRKTKTYFDKHIRMNFIRNVSF